MPIIATGPPKAGTSALRRLLEEMGLPRVNGSLIYDRWHRHPDWVYEEGPNAVFDLDHSKQRSIRYYRPRAEALAELKPGGFIHGHVPPFETGHQFIAILRDPEANIVSWFRAKRSAKTDLTGKQPSATPIADFQKWIKKGGCERALGFIKPIYVPWEARSKEGDDNQALIVRYEELRWPETVERIAKFAGKSPPRLDSWWGDSSKWTGRPSQPEEWFDKATRDYFQHWWKKAPSIRKI